MDDSILNVEGIDENHVEHRNFNGCEVNLYFCDQTSDEAEDIALESLLSSFERRIGFRS